MKPGWSQFISSSTKLNMRFLIGNLWSKIFKRLLENTVSTKENLSTAVRESWNQFERECYFSFVKSTPERIKAVIKAQGGSTEIIERSINCLSEKLVPMCIGLVKSMPEKIEVVLHIDLRPGWAVKIGNAPV